MRCPEDALLDRWLDGALSIDETAALALHVAGCSACVVRQDARLAEEQQWREVLALDAAELAALRHADLAAAWRHSGAATQPAHWWPALVVLSLAGAYAAWLVALPALELSLAAANRLGLLGVALAWLLGQAWYAGAAAIDTLAAPPLVDPSLVVATFAAGLWLVMSRPWELARAYPDAPNTP